MATAYYAQSAGANYFNTGPSVKRGYRVCDQCGVSETSAAKFRQCGACVRLPLLNLCPLSQLDMHIDR
jgi:hypothetical protein